MSVVFYIFVIFTRLCFIFASKVDLLNDIAHPPRILTNFAQAIQPGNFKRDLDSYLKTRAPVTFLSELRSHLQVRIIVQVIPVIRKADTFMTLCKLLTSFLKFLVNK